MCQTTLCYAKGRAIKDSFFYGLRTLDVLPGPWRTGRGWTGISRTVLFAHLLRIRRDEKRLLQHLF